MSAATDALREYAQAIRGDWGSIDGRGVRGDLEGLADAIDGGDGSDWPITRWREDLGICPSGQGHWTCHCEPTRTTGKGKDAYSYGCGNEPSAW